MELNRNLDLANNSKVSCYVDEIEGTRNAATTDCINIMHYVDRLAVRFYNIKKISSVTFKKSLLIKKGNELLKKRARIINLYDRELGTSELSKMERGLEYF